MVQYEPDEPLISQNTSILTQKNNQQVAMLDGEILPAVCISVIRSSLH